MIKRLFQPMTQKNNSSGDKPQKHKPSHKALILMHNMQADGITFKIIWEKQDVLEVPAGELRIEVDGYFLNGSKVTIRDIRAGVTNVLPGQPALSEEQKDIAIKELYSNKLNNRKASVSQVAQHLDINKISFTLSETNDNILNVPVGELRVEGGKYFVNGIEVSFADIRAAVTNVHPTQSDIVAILEALEPSDIPYHELQVDGESHVGKSVAPITTMNLFDK